MIRHARIVLLIAFVCTLFFLQSCAVMGGTTSQTTEDDNQTIAARTSADDEQSSDAAQPEPELPSVEIPSAVVFLETDIAGNPIEDARVRDAIVQELSTAGFTLVEVDFQAELFLPDDTQGLYDAMEDDVQRLIFGTASIIEVDERDGFDVQVRGSLRVYDLRENRSILLLSADANAQGSDSARTLNLVFSNLGQDFGNRLIERLP